MTTTKFGKTAGLALFALGACSQGSAPTAAAPTATRLRGTVAAVSPTAITIKTYDGQTATVPLDAKTGYAWVVASSLSTLKNGDFIGTATVGPDTALKAVELVIFPEAMRGTGEGHYAWDVPGIVASKGGGDGGSSSMTNGTVTQSSMTNGTVTQSAMTNGTVAKGADKTGEMQLTISYKGGTARVAVPTGTPIVRFEPTKATVLATGQKIFAVLPDATGKSAAKSVAIGKDGLTPPM